MIQRLAKKPVLLITGILIGVVYGVVTRIVFGQQATLVSLSFLVFVPAILGAIPLVFADEKQIRSYSNIIFIPWLTVATFFVAIWVMGYESVICLVILSAPFLVAGTIGALIVRLLWLRSEKRRTTLMTLAMIPFLLSPVEEMLRSPSQVYTVPSEVRINASASRIWDNIIRVPEIKSGEYTPGVFNYLGIPRPIEAELADENPGAVRIGRFEGGLTFIEHIKDWKPGIRVSFDIAVDPATIRREVFDQHVLKGNYFDFIDAAYEIEQVSGNQMRLKLVSRYRLTSKLNFYGKFWGNLMLKDFQDRLLAVIKLRCEE